MRTLIGRSAIYGIVLALVSATAALAQQGAPQSAQQSALQGAHATLVPQASRAAAPEFQLDDSSGTKKQLADYRGKVVLLNFWATACGGCKLEVPWLIDLTSAHKADSFTIVGVSMDTSYEGAKSPDQAWGQVKPYVSDHKMNYPVLMGDARLITSYKLGAVPATCLIDKQGRIAATYSGVADKSDVDSNIKKLLTEQ